MSQFQQDEEALKKPRVCKAWAVLSSKTPVVETTIELPPLREDEVEVKIAACGLCASDVGALSGHYDASGVYLYPIVAGHEGVGRVVGVGSLVRHLKLNDRVGLGILRDSCGACSECCHGKDNCCSQKRLMFALGQKGCFSEYVRINARYAIPIPDGIPTEVAGPLFCAGGTTFAPFRLHNILPGEHVGVVGVGGLGHLAVKFARAYGCRVTAFSRGTSKQEECKALGAHHFVDTTDPNSLKALPVKVNYLLLTASGTDVDIDFLQSALAPQGKIIVMGISGYAPTPVRFLGLIMNQSSLVGSAGSSLAHYIDMVQFSALHGITPQCEKYPISQINEAIEMVNKGTVRYRCVLVIDEALF